MSTSELLPSVAAVASELDHAILRPNTTREELKRELSLAAQYGVFSVCVRPCDVKPARKHLDALGSRTLVGTVIGFPHGSTSTEAKIAEVAQALKEGAKEFDMVLNIGSLKSGLYDEVLADINQVVHAARGLVVKVILETALLTTDEKIKACELASRGGASFVKTSTGYATGGATAEDLELMLAHTPAEVQVKASGGIRSLDILLEFFEMGVTRFGTSATKVILDELERRHQGFPPRANTDDFTY